MLYTEFWGENCFLRVLFFGTLAFGILLLIQISKGSISVSIMLITFVPESSQVMQTGVPEDLSSMSLLNLLQAILELCRSQGESTGLFLIPITLGAILSLRNYLYKFSRLNILLCSLYDFTFIVIFLWLLWYFVFNNSRKFLFLQ